MAALFDKIESILDLGYDLPAVPAHIRKNLSPAFELRPYQSEAFSRFLFYWDNKNLRQNQTQLLFHMATGSGKTLIMAGLVLHLYTLGYRNFLFFVSSANIIRKTKDNFLNPLSIKYLFSQTINIDNVNVKINEVDNFQYAAGNNTINIAFSTIQGLHSRLNVPQENSLTYDDFEGRKIVLISDEAHHINVDTKSGRLTSEEETEKVSWETTVNKIFRSNPENVLLEFTATIDMTNGLIEEKYRDKIIFDYPLRKFRLEKYSKEVEVLQSDTTLIERALLAVLLSQYRYKVFESNKLHIKPVVLFKSARIADSKNFHNEFIEKIKSLKKGDLAFVQKNRDRRIKDALSWFSAHNISMDNLIAELKTDFSEDKCIEINSKEESEENQIIINTLEMPANQYRAIFAVDKLNEGWDVLNLFDIVRLYDKRDADTRTGRPGKTTIAEAQLIGRGARYCPFKINAEQDKYKRKYDEDIQNPLRICEELYYHAAYNPRYITELHHALHEIGIKDRNTKEIQLSLKFDFKETDLYKDGFIFTNKQEKYDHSDIFSFSKEITGKVYKHTLRTGISDTTGAFDIIPEKTLSRSTVEYTFSDFGESLVRRAINSMDFYSFNNLSYYFPNIQSKHEFITSPSYLGKIKIEVSELEDDIHSLSSNQRLEIIYDVLEQIEITVKESDVEYSGSAEFEPYDFKSVFKDKTLNIFVSDVTDKEYGRSQKDTDDNELRIDLSRKGWYAFTDNFGTSEEKHLVKYIDKAYEKLQKKYKDIYLVRNEGHFKLYSFEGGRVFEPDFVLFLTEKKYDISIYYQVFLEPKGEHLFEHDKWKEDFLLQLRSKHKIKQLWRSKNYVVWGMPFFNSNVNNPGKYPRFDKAFSELQG
jgi:type III restriction enzyme